MSIGGHLGDFYFFFSIGYNACGAMGVFFSLGSGPWNIFQRIVGRLIIF